MLYWLSRDCARNWVRFPFNQSAGFEFSTTSRSEWNGIFKKFRKQGNLARYTQIFNFFSWKFSFQSTLPPFPNFGKFWLDGKRPVSKFDTTLSQSLARPQMAILNWICDFILRGTGPLKTTMDVIDAAKVIRLSMLRLVTIKGVSNSSTRSWPPNWAKHFFTATKVDERFEWHCKYKELKNLGTDSNGVLETVSLTLLEVYRCFQKAIVYFCLSGSRFFIY